MGIAISDPIGSSEQSLSLSNGNVQFGSVLTGQCQNNNIVIVVETAAGL